MNDCPNCQQLRARAQELESKWRTIQAVGDTVAQKVLRREKERAEVRLAEVLEALRAALTDDLLHASRCLRKIERGSPIQFVDHARSYLQGALARAEAVLASMEKKRG